MAVINESNDHSRIAVFSCTSPSLMSWKNWWANCIRLFCGVMVCGHNFIHCLLISTKILYCNGTKTRPIMARGRWTVLEAQSSESSMDWSNPDTLISTLLRNLQSKHLRCALNKIQLPVTRRWNYWTEFCQKCSIN